MSKRLEKLREKIARLKLDALIITRRENQKYIAGYTGSADLDVILLVTPNDARIITDSRYWTEAEVQARAFSIIKITTSSQRAKAIADFVAMINARTVGFESEHVPYATFREWQKALRKAHAKLQPTSKVVEAMRAVKDEGELAIIRRAVELTDHAYAFVVRRIQPGMTERQVAWLIESFLREHGGERMAFDAIVASGPNAALPHATVTDRAVQAGEPITIDIGVRIDGYNSDLTRTICLGAPDAKFQEIYNIVLKAQQTVERKTRAGMGGKRAHALARRVIEKAGYGDNFGHGTGHGVGLAVHEIPGAGMTSKDVLQPNMTLTVEPGIYLPGWGGVRIEDLVIIQENGVEVLSRASKEPIIPLNGK